MERRTVEELERSLSAAERKAVELQAWADASDREAEQLRARVAALEAAAASPTVISAPPREDARVQELQAWVDSAEAEAEQLRARITELEARIAQKVEEPRVDALQARVEAEQKEADNLRAQLGAAQAEVAVLEGRVELPGGGEGEQLARENRELVGRLSQLEAVNHKLRQLTEELSGQVSSGAQRDRERLEAQLTEARAQGAGGRVVELERALLEASEAVATLEVQRVTAVEQARRSVEDDAPRHERQLRDLEDKHHQALSATQRELATLEAQLAEKTGEVSVLQARLKVHEGDESKLVREVSTLRERAHAAEASTGALQAALDALRVEKDDLEHRAADLAHKLGEAQRSVAQGELERTELGKQLEGLKTEHAGRLARTGQEAAAPPAGPTPPPPPADAAEEDLEGSSGGRLDRLAAQLAAEQHRSGVLQQYVKTSEESLKRLSDELAEAKVLLVGMATRLGLAASETGEPVERLEAARRELHALSGELARAKAPPAQPADDGPELPPEDVLEAPMEALEQLAQQQDAAAKQATEGLAGEQRAREALVNDLQWLKAELEKLSSVREELKHRLAATVQRELKRKAVVSRLLGELRQTEVAAAARAGALRRLHAAMELAQKTAVKAQTSYFQKQIGSLHRQLESALGHRAAGGPVRRGPW